MRRRLDWYQRHTSGPWLAFAVGLGALQAIFFRYSMNPDGIASLVLGGA
jgi:hypothetical protein